MWITRKGKTSLISLWSKLSTGTALCAGFIIVVMMVLVVYEVWMRYIALEPVTWAIDAVQLLFLVAIYLGLAYTTRSGGHVRFDVISILLPQRWKALLSALTCFAAGVASAALLQQLITVLKQSVALNWRTATPLPITIWPWYAVAVVGCFFMTIEWIGLSLTNWQEFRRRNHKKPT